MSFNLACFWIVVWGNFLADAIQLDDKIDKNEDPLVRFWIIVFCNMILES